MRASTGLARLLWLATSALAMGGGVWSMRFIAMLAFSVPGLDGGDDLGLTVLSLLVPVAVTGLGFHVVSWQGAGFRTLALGGLVMGLGIAAMHYGGMAANLSHDHLWVAVSLLIAVGASTVALWLTFGRVGEVGFAVQAVAAVAMGLAVSGMHYAAMQGVSFSAGTCGPGMDGATGAASLDQTRLALAVAATTFLILALIAAMFDRRFAHLAEREAAALRASEERFRIPYTRTPLPL